MSRSFNAPRRSETVQQQEYEAQILDQHYPLQQVHSDEQELVASNDAECTQHLPGQFPSGEIEKGGMKAKMKSFWNKTVVPAFPEAVGDISLIKKAMRVEANVTQDIQNPEKYPEISKVAHVRTGLELCIEERNWLSARKQRVKQAFCCYMSLNETQVHIDDVPIVAFGGSGGGYRALIGMLGYAVQMKDSGLWDMLSYVAGVSGSCWTLAAYYTWGQADWQRVVEHVKQRLSPYHPLSPEAVREVLQSEHGPALTLGPLVQKHRSGLETVAMDFYSVFTTGHLFLNSHVAGPNDSAQKSWLKWSSAIIYLESGQEPLPLLTAIRHERPWKDWANEKRPFKNTDPHDQEHSKANDAWFQWFELSPFEVGCDELQAWSPIWAFGRPFEHGKSTVQLPEQSLSLLLGLCTSAPAGPLTSYLATIKRSLPPGFLGKSVLDVSKGVARMWGKQGKEEFQQHHPLDPCSEHNFMFHLSENSTYKENAKPIENTPTLELMDSGLDNNCPTYVFLHPARRVDLILNMDASSDVQKDSFPQRVDQIGSRKGIKFMKRDEQPSPNVDSMAFNKFAGQYGQTYDGTLLKDKPETVIDSYGHEVYNPPAPRVLQECSMVYMPLLPNEDAVAGFDPSTAKFSGSYNLVWTAEQVEMLMKVSQANCKQAEAAIKSAVMEAYMRNKAQREAS
ncbi:Cytosolic phospholipase A2 epsilon [Cyphellophora attinorum]|uniref:Lysophospholipase n=1 Tax=Cyphellophora attinorum TaxID=1664694 RepID=A0A0N1P3N7_9EURO|nr:Cytosolic phospholipase A2 epsilon [Phialophora attinorum]KPI44265.1 Cytosolic phospholipase A2 epsilon [Phialophora attinorum]